MAQGIARNKEEVIEALRPYFELDYSVNKACSIVGIAQSTVQTWIDEDDDLRLKIQSWRAKPSVKARQNWVDAIYNGRPTKFGDDFYTPAKEWLERREKEDWAVKTETDVTSGGLPLQALPLTPAIAEATKEFEEKIKKSVLE